MMDFGFLSQPLKKRVFSVEEVREDFPILKRRVNDYPLAYLDSAATAQKPQHVLDAMSYFYTHYYANVHRGTHTLSLESSELLDLARARVATFLNARSPDQNIVFTKSSTEASNILAYGLTMTLLQENDHILVSDLEHHANLVPWILHAKNMGKKIHVHYAKGKIDGSIDEEHYLNVLKSYPIKVVSVTGASNILGRRVNLARLSQLAKEQGALFLVDASQWLVHTPLDVQALSVDALFFTAHKLYGPTGVGALYLTESLKDQLPPLLGGGDMVVELSRDSALYQSDVTKFEGGTPAIAEIVGFKAALDYIESFDRSVVERHEQEVALQLYERLRQDPDIELYTHYAPSESLPIMSFNLKGANPYDASALLDRRGVAVRSGRHCATFAQELVGIDTSMRASLGLYSRSSEVDQFFDALSYVKRMLS